MLFYIIKLRNITGAVAAVALGLFLINIFGVAAGCAGGDPAMVRLELVAGIIAAVICAVSEIVIKIREK